MIPEIIASAELSQHALLGIKWLDPEYLLSASGPFGKLILPGMLAIIFVECGLLFPILPGDSLLFTAGLLTRTEDPFAPIWLVMTLAPIAAILGDNCGYWIGRLAGTKISAWEDGRLYKKKYLQEAHNFFMKYGPFTIVMCRFVPIVRTFAPVTAGMSKMPYFLFLPFSILGGILWGAGVTGLGWLLGEIPWVRENIDVIFLGIVAVSVIPLVVPVVTGFLQKNKASTEA